MPNDLLTLLERLTESGLEFVIVGGVAARLYGSPRITQDLDVVPKMDEKAWGRAVDVLLGSGSTPENPGVSRASA